MADGLVVDRLWFSDAADPTDVRGFRYVGDSYQVTQTAGGSVESGYASGRSRGYSTEDDTVQVRVTLHALDAEDRAWLTAHRGRPACFRDPLGLKVFLTYYAAGLTFSSAPATAADHTCDLDATSVYLSEVV